MKSQTVDVTESQFRGRCAHFSSPVLYFADENLGPYKGVWFNLSCGMPCGRK